MIIKLVAWSVQVADDDIKCEISSKGREFQIFDLLLDMLNIFSGSELTIEVVWMDNMISHVNITKSCQ